MEHIEGILPKGPYLPCVSMAGRALLAGYHWYDISLCLHPNINVVVIPTVFCGWVKSCPLVTDAKFLSDVITKNRMKKINSRLNSNCQWKFISEICSWCIDLAIYSIMALMICGINHILIIPLPNEVGGGVYWIHLVHHNLSAEGLHYNICRNWLFLFYWVFHKLFI